MSFFENIPAKSKYACLLNSILSQNSGFLHHKNCKTFVWYNFAHFIKKIISATWAILNSFLAGDGEWIQPVCKKFLFDPDF